MIRLFHAAVTSLFMAALATSVQGADYTVMFNCWDSTGAGGCQRDFDANHPGLDSAVFTWYPWGSLGARRGSRIPNLSSRTIRAFHLKIDGTNDTFTVPSNAGGVLFPEVWRKKDGKEVIFNVAAGGAGIRPGSRFWSLVSPGTPGFPASYFLGKASDERIADPNPNDWDKIGSESFARCVCEWAGCRPKADRRRPAGQLVSR